MANSPWQRLVVRSMIAWDDITLTVPATDLAEFHTKRLEAMHELLSIPDLDTFMQCGYTNVFFFFQLRDVFQQQQDFTRWSRDRLDDYVLFPSTRGFINNKDCCYVSYLPYHPIQGPERTNEPNPQKQNVQQLKSYVGSESWKFIFLHWSCMPQDANEVANAATYLARTRWALSLLMRQCAFAGDRGFHWEGRLWTLWEHVEFYLTTDDDGPNDALANAWDTSLFAQHVRMVPWHGARHVLTRMEYIGDNDHEQAVLTSWLEVLVLRYWSGITRDERMEAMHRMTCTLHETSFSMDTYKGEVLLVQRFAGVFRVGNMVKRFTPFPLTFLFPSALDC